MPRSSVAVKSHARAAQLRSVRTLILAALKYNLSEKRSVERFDKIRDDACSHTMTRSRVQFENFQEWFRRLEIYGLQFVTISTY